MFWGFQRNEYFWGYEDFVDILGVYHIIGLYLRVISMHFRLFHSVKVYNRGYFLGLLKFQIIFGVLEILDIFGVSLRCWA